MRRPTLRPSYGNKKQTGISKKAMAMTVACNAREIPSVEQLMRAPYSLRENDARQVIMDARKARGE